LGIQGLRDSTFQSDNYILWTLYYYEFFHEGFKCLDNKILGYNFINKA